LVPTKNGLEIRTTKRLEKGNTGWINLNLLDLILILIFLVYKPSNLFFFPQTNKNIKKPSVFLVFSGTSVSIMPQVVSTDSLSLSFLLFSSLPPFLPAALY
jgi:hypothetical protein